MIRGLIKIGLIVLACIVGYNYFFGTDEERDQSRKIFGQMKGLAGSAVSLIRAEKDKFNHGKYDQALDKLGTVYRGLRDKAKYLDEKVLGRLDNLEQRKQALEQELKALDAEPQAAAPAPADAKKVKKKNPKEDQLMAAKAADLERKKAELMKKLDDLARETESLTQDAEKSLE